MKARYVWTCLTTCLFLAHFSMAQEISGSPIPRIVNIVNFIRLLEPRNPAITEDVLYQTVVRQVEIMQRYHLKGTFLVQYDALMDPRYQKLLKQLPADEFEVGAWWEIPQPLVENAGMKWRGRYPWDWRANVGFSTGYSQVERKKLVDTYMRAFRKIFGRYPATVASWFIDAYTLGYMYQKYHIVASANCKDQYGTDGYTLWGGYWNQAYYPSKINAYMPAQHAGEQLPVPIFRMLGSDPVRQYDNALGSSRQGVVTLEPVYRFGGGDSVWVHWFFQQLINGECLAFAYAQTGQENSFTWNAMKKGYDLQMPLIARLRDEHRIRVETLGESGRWYRSHFVVTPATAVTVEHDIEGSNAKTAWYDSRFYRTNLIWEDGRLRIRDLHLFDEKFPSHYFNRIATSNDCRYFTLPFTDGYVWSSKDTLAGIRFRGSIGTNDVALEGDSVDLTRDTAGNLQIIWWLKRVPGRFVITCSEKNMSIKFTGPAAFQWHLELSASRDVPLPFTKIQPKMIGCSFEGFRYHVTAEKGQFIQTDHSVFDILPSGNTVNLAFAQ